MLTRVSEHLIDMPLSNILRMRYEKLFPGTTVAAHAQIHTM